MKFNKKRAYTLAEIMVVILILTIIFAAFAPIYTKRRLAERNSGDIWKDSMNVATHDVYFDANNAKLNAQSFIGVDVSGEGEVREKFKPSSKLVIRSNDAQHQIQFRYKGGLDEVGNYAGTWLNNFNNMLLGGSYKDITQAAMGNTAIGYNALNSIQENHNNTAVGAYALSNGGRNGTAEHVTDESRPGNMSNYTAVGYKIATKIRHGKQNTLIGSFIDVHDDHDSMMDWADNNTAVGYQIGPANAPTDKYMGDYNVSIGAYSGAVGVVTHGFNTAIGYAAMNNSSNFTDYGHQRQYNVAIGAGALKNITTGSYNVAIGYNACANVTSANYVTCIGANSGPGQDTGAENVTHATTSAGSGDVTGVITTTEANMKAQRTYIGSRPKGNAYSNGFGGDAVLEIHNMKTTNSGLTGTGNSYINTYTSAGNSTTVINGNLIVKGRPFFTSDGKLQHFHDGHEIKSQDNKGENIVSNYPYGYYSTGDEKYANCGDPHTYKLDTCVKFGIGDSANWSDRRLKNIGSKNNDGLDKISQLKVFNYTFKSDDKKLPHVGVMAQDLLKVFPNSVFKGEDGYLRIRWDEMFFAAINAVKELDRKIVALVKRTTNAEVQISKLEQENVILQAEVKALTARVNKLKAQ